MWWWHGVGTAVAGDSEVNAPSLWSGGIVWADDDTVAPYKGYWQTSANATDRTGTPELSIAVDGVWVNGTIRHANWQLGRDQWISSPQTSAASFDVEGSFDYDVLSVVVIAVMSDVTDQHSDPLWVGYVDSISESTDTSGRVTTSVSCVDILGLLAQTRMRSSTTYSGTVEDIITDVVADSDLSVTATGNPLSANYASGSREDGETVLGFIGRVEQAAAAFIALQHDGTILVIYAGSFAAPDPVDLDASVASWTRDKSPTTIINDWDDLAYDTTAARDSRLTYGRRSYSPDRSLEVSDWWGDLIISDAMTVPRWLVTSSDLPITDLSDAPLFIDPFTRITLGGDYYQAMTVSHDVSPGHVWRMSITADSTIESLMGITYP